MRRCVIRVLAVLGIAAVALLLVTRWYLTSRAAADRVQDQLTQILRASVRVESVDLGFAAKSTFSRMQLGDAFLTAAVVEADASAWTLGWGGWPANLTLTDVALVLQFDERGNLLTRLPQPDAGGTIPRLRIRSGTVTLKQQGRPDLVVRGVEAVLRSEGDVIRLEGEFDDPRWKKGTVTGDFDHRAGTLHGTVQTDVVHMTPKDLEGLPFVPASTWKQVRCEGDTSARIEFRVVDREFHYRVDLRPTQTRVQVTAIDLTAEQASGRILIEDDVVRLEGVEGQTARGTIRTDAVLDFRAATNLKFGIKVARLDLQQLPRTWKLPPLVGGSLSGQADLHLTVADGAPRTAGRGEGEITGASILGFEAKQPIRVRMAADGKGFHFDTLVGGRVPIPLPLDRPLRSGLFGTPR